MNIIIYLLGAAVCALILGISYILWVLQTSPPL